MKTDRELLELAARACGYKPDGLFGKGLCVVTNEGEVNQKSFSFDPLTDDGDALRLAIKTKVLMNLTKHLGKLLFEEGEQPSIEHAVRRAIVRAAAEIQLQKERNQ